MNAPTISIAVFYGGDATSSATSNAERPGERHGLTGVRLPDNFAKPGQPADDGRPPSNVE